MADLVALDARLASRTMTGDTSYWRGLIGGLARLESETVFLLFSNAPRPPGIPETARVRWIQTAPAGDRWWSLVRFPLAARRAGARALHTQYFLSPLVGRHGVTTVHDVSFFIGPQWFGLKDRLLLQSQVPASVRRAARVLTVSETSRQEIERAIPAARGKTVVTPNALREGFERPDDATARRLVASLGVEEPYLLTVGTRWPRKNTALAIEAAARAGRRLVVTGKPWGDAEAAGPLYTGYVDDAHLAALYARAALYLAPAFHEGFGIPLLEAFASGCPVVCSNGGALPEVAGGAAEVVPTFDPTDWAERIEGLLVDSGKVGSMRERGYERVKAFDWLATARLTEQAYREAMA